MRWTMDAQAHTTLTKEEVVTMDGRAAIIRHPLSFVD
jgi:hypothetical protein